MMQPTLADCLKDTDRLFRDYRMDLTNAVGQAAFNKQILVNQQAIMRALQRQAESQP